MTEITVLAKLLKPNPHQPTSRLKFKAEDLEDLNSIGTIGLQQKPKARRNGDGEYQLLFGHRRVAWWDAHLIPPAEKAAPVKSKARARPAVKKAKGKGKKK